MPSWKPSPFSPVTRSGNSFLQFNLLSTLPQAPIISHLDHGDNPLTDFFCRFSEFLLWGYINKSTPSSQGPDDISKLGSTKTQAKEPMSLLGWLTEHQWVVTDASVGDFITATLESLPQHGWCLPHSHTEPPFSQPLLTYTLQQFLRRRGNMQQGRNCIQVAV